MLVLTNLAYAEAPWLAVKSLSAATSLVWKELPMEGSTAHSFEQQITDLEPFLAENWKARVSPKSGNPVYERPVILVIYRNDHKFLLDQIVPKPGGTVADYDLVIASQPYRARASLEFKAKRVLAPLARALGPGGRMIAIHSYGHDPGMEIIHKVWPNDNPFVHSRHDLLKAVKHELGPAGRDLNFNAYSDQRSLFRYDMHTLPSEISSSIGTSTLLAAWNAAIYVAQIEDDRLSDVHSDRRYIEATRDVLQKHGGLWFYDESFVISHRREIAHDPEKWEPVFGQIMRKKMCPVPEPSAFARHFSLEATRPNAAEIAALAEILPPGTPVYLTAVPTVDTAASWWRRRLACARPGSSRSPISRRGGSPSAGAIERSCLAGLRGEADMRRLLVIGGDVDASGPFADALAVIQKGRLREAGIEEIGIGGYPEGHPRIAPGRLEAALDQKIAAARAAGLRGHIVSQFSFSPERILAWLRQLRACGIAVPVKVGMAGPASLTGAVALRQALRRFRLAARPDVGGAGAGLIGPCRAGPHHRGAGGGRRPGDAAPHYFSFGGTVETARYACEAAAGRIAAGHAMARQIPKLRPGK